MAYTTAFAISLCCFSAFAFSSELSSIAGVNIDHTLNISDYAAIKDYGFRYVRLSFPRMPFYRNGFPEGVNQEAYRIFEENLIFSHLENIKIVVDPHFYPGMSGLYSMKPSDDFWSDRRFQQYVVDFWSDFSSRYRGNENIYAYDVINEPSPPRFVDGVDRCAFLIGFYDRIIGAIRANDKVTNIIVQFPMALNSDGGSTNQMDGASCFPAQADWKGVIYSFHMYDPGQFTHQGVGKFPTPVYLYKEKDRNKIVDYLRARVGVVNEWKNKYHADVLIGEFGASKFSGAEGDMYVQDLLNIFDDMKLGWFFHSFRESTVWSPEFFDQDHGKYFDSPGFSKKMQSLEKSAKKRAGG